MINKYLLIASAIISFLIVTVLFPEGVMGILIGIGLGSAIIHLIRIKTPDLQTQTFLINIFIAALLVRAILAIVIYGFDLQIYFGPDAMTYDFQGKMLADYWWGQATSIDINYNSSGWGMPLFVGAIYFVAERNPLAAQIIEALLGASTVVLAYKCSLEIFKNNRVARYTAFFIAFFPSMFIWQSQLLKDGLIIFFLVLALLAALRLQQSFNYSWVFLLLLSLLAISSLRFYIFFMLIAAIGGGFILSAKTSAKNLLTRFVICLLVGISFTFLGVWRLSGDQAEKYVNLDRLQASRKYSAEAANSGIKDDVDLTSSTGIVTALPIGLLNLYLAPFPWQVSSLTQVFTMPEMIIWWSCLPFLFTGVMYAIKHRLSESVSVLFFTIILSLSYAVYQGNLGTLYRQRAQIQVFLLFFVAVGVTLMFEKQENKKIKKRLQKGLNNVSLIK